MWNSIQQKLKSQNQIKNTLENLGMYTLITSDNIFGFGRPKYQYLGASIDT